MCDYTPREGYLNIQLRGNGFFVIDLLCCSGIFLVLTATRLLLWLRWRGWNVLNVRIRHIPSRLLRLEESINGHLSAFALHTSIAGQDHWVLGKDRIVGDVVNLEILERDQK